MKGRYLSVSRCKKDKSEENAKPLFTIITIAKAKSKVKNVSTDRRRQQEKYR